MAHSYIGTNQSPGTKRTIYAPIELSGRGKIMPIDRQRQKTTDNTIVRALFAERSFCIRIVLFELNWHFGFDRSLLDGIKVLFLIIRTSNSSTCHRGSMCHWNYFIARECMMIGEV